MAYNVKHSKPSLILMQRSYFYHFSVLSFSNIYLWLPISYVQFPRIQTLRCRKFTGEGSWNQLQSIKGSRTEQYEKTKCNEVVPKALADPTGNSGVWMVLQSCLKPRQGRWVFHIFRNSLQMWAALKGGGTLGKAVLRPQVFNRD